MKHIIFYTSQEDWVQPLVSDPQDFQIQLTSQPSFSGAADCILLSQQYAGNQLLSALDQLKSVRMPCAVVTYDGSLENQERLLACGADDVIVLPLAPVLLRKRIRALSETIVQSDGTEINFAAFDRIYESNQGTGSFIVAEHDFMNIYRFISRILERLEQKAQLIIFRFRNDDGPFMESDSVLHFLKVVQTCLRRGDISSMYGKQMLVILMGADAANGQQVINRVISTFNAHYNMDESCKIIYEMREISAASSKPNAE